MFVINRLRKSDGRLIDAIYDSLKSAYDPDISRFFVLQDASYREFFRSAVDHPSYATYYSYDSASGELNGFACFHIIGEVAFLKHIVVDNRMRGSRLGTKLLYSALRDLQLMPEHSLKWLQLHVFEKNSRALSWYLSIGMQIVGCNYWYDACPALPFGKVNPNYEEQRLKLSKDGYGFVQVYYADDFIGVLLDGKSLNIKNTAILSNLPLLASVVAHLNASSVGFTSDTAYKGPFSLVDKSLLMSTDIHQLECVI